MYQFNPPGSSQPAINYSKRRVNRVPCHLFIKNNERNYLKMELLIK